MCALGELSDAEKQLSDGGSSAHELDKAKKKLETEKEELVTALEVCCLKPTERGECGFNIYIYISFWQEAEAQLENEESRLLRVQLELTQLKQEMERRLNEKDDETESGRKNQQRQLQAMQHTVDVEVKAKNDQVKQRKLVEAQVDEMQAQIDELEKVSKNKVFHKTSIRSVVRQFPSGKLLN